MRVDHRASAHLQKGTKRRALLVFLILVALVAMVGIFWPNPRSRTQIELYLRQGTRQGAELLMRDIRRLSPEGRDPGPAVQHLGALGLQCAAPETTVGEWRCLMRRQADNRKLVTIEAVIRVDHGVVVGSSASITETPR
ncbi:hypothetical protein [Roseococcus pinisoli]|uniref:Uncharacterized protein n=1 Tax=Roseococcus pinisoli TaxID=2835040 RepID=A0ABS5QF78_9PROT|nr:hypothetical protein [Roseococcus pinisoli]MBS7811961.1 hypothetical protein [Roseococcus pinisoli]